MTIKYLDSKRLSGVASDTKPTDVQDNSIYIETDTDRRYWFKPSTLNMNYSSGWTQVGTQITTGSDQVTFSSALCGTDRRVYKALGFTLDDTFTVEWEFSLTDSGSSQGQPFALTAGTSQLDNSTTNQDSIYFKSSSSGYQLACKDGTTNTQSSASTYTNGTTLYARLVRSGTSGTLSVYSDASRSTLVNSATHTIPATVTGLNTLQHGVDAVQSGTRTLTGSISNVRVFNGSTIGTSWTSSSGISRTGCLVYYNFEDTGSTLTNQATTANGFPDGLGSSADATNSGGKTVVTGKVDNAWEFGGGSGQDTYADTPVFTGSGNFTMSAWVNGDLFANGRSGDVIIQNYSSSNTGGFQWYISNGISTYYTSTSEDSVGNVLSANTWYHLVIVRNNNVVTFYENGVSTGTLANTHNITGSVNYFNIGSQYSYSGYNFDGTMDEVSLWNRALTTDEISRLYNSGNGVGI